MTNLAEIKERLLQGGEISLEEAYILASLGEEHLPQLLETAAEISRHYFRQSVDLCAILPAKVGLCGGDCAFCAQSNRHNCPIEIRRVEDFDLAAALAYMRRMKEMGAKRFSLVTSGEALTEREFSQVLRLYEELGSAIDMDFCASLGTLTQARALRLREAGISRYHHNLETSRSFFPHICTTHSYESKLATIREARSAGLEVCSGGIISLGETMEQRLELAFDLRELDVDCVPLNILNPIPGTRLQYQPLLSVEEILRTIALFRLILPRKSLRFAGGREKALGDQEYRGYLYGINGAIIGDYLTTKGHSNLDKD